MDYLTTEDIFNEIHSLSNDSEKLAVLIPYVEDLISKQNQLISTLQTVTNNQVQIVARMEKHEGLSEQMANIVADSAEASAKAMESVNDINLRYISESDQVSTIFNSLNRLLDRIEKLEDWKYSKA